MSEVGFKRITRRTAERMQKYQEEPLHGDPSTPYVSSDSVEPQVDEGGRNRVRATPRTYDGRSSWREHRRHFERVCRVNGWRGDLMLDVMWVHLTDAALTYVDNLADERTGSYDQLCQAMEERFGDGQRKEAFKSELRSRKRREGEALPALAHAISLLVTRAYPDMASEGRDELSIEYFRDSLPDHEQRMEVFKSKARTIDHAVKAALDTEAWQISERRRALPRARAVSYGENEEQHDRPSRRSSAERSMEARMERIEKLLERRATEDGTERNSRGRTPRCYYCDAPGHMARECLKKKTEMRRNHAASGNDRAQY